MNRQLIIPRRKLFKVVRVEGDRMLSVVAEGEWALEYQVGVTTRPKEGLIFTFRSLMLAKDWLIPNTAILEGIGYGVRELKMPSNFMLAENYRLIWSEYRRIIEGNRDGIARPGWCLCNGFRPTRIIEKYVAQIHDGEVKLVREVYDGEDEKK